MEHKKKKRPGYKTLTTTQSNEATHTQCARMKHFVGEKTWSFWKGRGLMVEKKREEKREKDWNGNEDGRKVHSCRGQERHKTK